MLIPVFTLYAHDMTGANPMLIGIAFGIYGLTQACLQIPMGYLSDKMGRKPIITIGLVAFALGSLLGAFATSIWTLIAARALQGAGAIGSTLIALLADLTDDDKRTKSMAMLGMVIGLSFSIAMVLGPIFAHHFKLAGIFWFIFALALLGIILLHTVVPTPQKEVFHADSQPNKALFKQTFSNPDLKRLNVGIFCQHAIFTAMFYAIPLILATKSFAHWVFYLPIIVCSFVLAVPLIIIAEKKRKLRSVFLGSVTALVFIQVLLSFFHGIFWLFTLFLFIFFIAFNVLEASLPSLVTKQSPINSKGTAMGIYSTCQFLGIFVGGASSGFLYHHFDITAIFIFCGILGLMWLTAASSMTEPKYFKSVILPITINTPEQAILKERKLLEIKGIIEVNISIDEKVAYLKVDSNDIDLSALKP